MAIIYGKSGNDYLIGTTGNDTLSGGLGADTMIGGDGSDSYYVDNAGDVVTEYNNDALGGVDTVYSSVSFTLGYGLENLYLKGYDNINGTGNGNNNYIVGNNGNNILDGGLGADTLIGNDGSDTYYVDDAADVVTEYKNDASGGVDTVYSSVSYTLGFGLENLNLTGSGNINGTGNGNNNYITGNAGNNNLDGGLGADTLIGGNGSDTYFVDDAADIVTEYKNDASGGVDIVHSSVSYSLGFGLEHLILIGSDNINGTGNDNNNFIFGNGGNNIIDGGSGNDTLIGGDGADTLIGGDDADTLIGGLGADTMIGGDGSDTYYLDSSADVVTEFKNDASGGIDTVNSSISYTLGFGLENLNLTGSDNINGTGNDNNNVITGNAGNNILDGGLSADTLIGGNGSDTYYVGDAADVATEYNNDASGGIDTVYSSVSFTLGYGLENLNLTGSGNINGTGNDNSNVITGTSADNILDGGLGADTLIGGNGSDTYYVDDAADVATEDNNDALGGVDTVYSSVSYTLGFGLENLNLTGSGNINGTGNGNNNYITGNSGNNILDGGLGVDTMIGGDGNDIYQVDDAADIVTEYKNDAQAGFDRVNSSLSYSLGYGLEQLNLIGSGNINGTGNDNNNFIFGNGGNNIIDGGSGTDTLIGGNGADTLIGGDDADTLVGGNGADTFVFNNISEGIDIIKSFELIEGEKIQINKIGFGATSLAEFSYNSLNGDLSFLGNTFATIENKPAEFAVSLYVEFI